MKNKTVKKSNLERKSMLIKLKINPKGKNLPEVFGLTKDEHVDAIVMVENAFLRAAMKNPEASGCSITDIYEELYKNEFSSPEMFGYISFVTMGKILLQRSRDKEEKK